ncbi:MAG TPA: pYEATS domain-containing protein [Nitrososphaeraceae archaeon]|nr:pYEATS domain-containing protein [Nitrososphaeraceae archaeon]
MKEDNKKLLVSAVEINPREAKRFINNIILAKSVFNKPVDRLLVVQVLSFRHEWGRFLTFITDDDTRKDFLSKYKTLKRHNKTVDDQDLEIFNKEMSEKYPLFEDMLKNNPKFFRQNDLLLKFLDESAADRLLAIDNMEEYRRALDYGSPKALKVSLDHQAAFIPEELRKEKRGNPYSIKVWVEGPPYTLSLIYSVTYYLHPSFKQSEVTVNSPEDKFAL